MLWPLEQLALLTLEMVPSPRLGDAVFLEWWHCGKPWRRVTLVKKKGPVPPDSVSAQELADAAEEDYNTIDHWTNGGLLPHRRVGRRRFYLRSESLSRCKRIRALQNDGHSLATIRGLL